jgi:hypothetical protein
MPETAFTLAEYLQPVLDRLDPVPALLVGARHLAEQGAPPRIVWVPDADDYEGGFQREADRRVVLDAWTGLACHVWGADPDAVRELRRALIAALVAEYGTPSLRFRGSGWLRPDAGEWTQDGEVYVLRVALRETVWEQPSTTVEIETTALAPRADSASGDGHLDFGEG